MVQVKGFSINITSELQQLLTDNPPKKVKKAVISKVKDDQGNLVQEKDQATGELKSVDAVHDLYPYIYFDKQGNYYLHAFRTTIIDGKEVIVTNPNVKTEKDCPMYGRGMPSHQRVIPGSEYWDNGSESTMPTRETIAKGKPETRIVLVLSREEVLDIELKPTGNGILAQFANASPAEKAAIAEMLGKKDEDYLGKDINRLDSKT